MKDYRQLILAFVIAILFSIFVFSMVEAIYLAPDYTECYSVKPLDRNASAAEIEAERLQSQECYDAQNAIREEYDFVRFLISVIVGVIAIVVGMYVNVSTPVGMAVASGLLLGGLFTVFFGTMSGWSSIGRILRPIIILGELILVIWVAYKKLNGSGKKK